VLHQATLSRQFFYSLRTQDSLICPNCKQAVAHTCSSTSAILQPPLSRYEHQPLSMLGNPSRLQIQGNLFGEHVAAQSSSAFFNASVSASHVQPPPPTSSNISPSSFFTSHSTNPYPTPVMLGNPATHFTGPTAQGDFFGEHVVARSAHTAFESFASHLQPLPPRSSDTSSVFTYHSTDPNPYHTTSLPFSTVSSPRPTSFYPTLYPPSPSIAINSQYNCSNHNSSLGKRDPHRTDLECKPERKRARQNLPEERANENQQSGLHLSQCLDTSSLCPPSFNKTTRCVSEVLPTTSEDGADVSKQGSEVDRSIRYNSEVERALDASFLRSIDVGQAVIHCLQFSQDGKYLAVACWGDKGMTNIYDVETGEKTWLVFHESFCFG